jgi:DsbC/DsbD-like thiol-disulfide interchange protein
MDENFAYLLRAATLAAAVIAGPALAGGPYASTALLTGWAEDEGARIAGLSIELAPGWKTYWRQPGDAGVPPRFDWSGSDNVAEVTVIWPRPHAFDSFGYRTIGYKDAVTLPLRVVAVDPSMPVTLRLSFDYGVCSDICVPARDELSLLIHASAAMESMTPGAWIDRTAIDVTLLGDDQAIAVAACGG